MVVAVVLFTETLDQYEYELETFLQISSVLCKAVRGPYCVRTVKNEASTRTRPMKHTTLKEVKLRLYNTFEGVLHKKFKLARKPRNIQKSRQELKTSKNCDKFRK